MANAGLQILGYTLAILGWIAVVASTIMPQWKMSSYAGDNIITAQAVYQGLWMNCVFQSTGQMQCKVYDSILALGASLQATRALMVVGIVVGILALGISTVGMKCTKCGGDDKVRKARIAMSGGIAFILAGLCVLIGASWFGNQIVRDFYNPLTPVNTKYEFGSAIFVNWAGAALVLIGGGMLSCSCPRKSGYPSSYPKSKARSKASSNKEFV
ncbi:claudin-7-like [Pristis pectinata]|uniref:claudin-7-like n=1 Tax=Pristis pectinata TaxID=685728 RepID=UPI00223DEA46|nr:claudin-7-like [Pristis pectinata]